MSDRIDLLVEQQNTLRNIESILQRIEQKLSNENQQKDKEERR